MIMKHHGDGHGHGDHDEHEHEHGHGPGGPGKFGKKFGPGGPGGPGKEGKGFFGKGPPGKEGKGFFGMAFGKKHHDKPPGHEYDKALNGLGDSDFPVMSDVFSGGGIALAAPAGVSEMTLILGGIGLMAALWWFSKPARRRR